MPNIKFSTVLLYILIKYVLFYILVMLINENYTFVQFYLIRNIDDFNYYLFTFSFLPIIYTVLFSVFIYFSFTAKHVFVFAAIFVLVTIAEYFVYVFFNSQEHIDEFGVYNAIISTVVFIVLFRKPIAANYVKGQSGDKEKGNVA